MHPTPQPHSPRRGPAVILRGSALLLGLLVLQGVQVGQTPASPAPALPAAIGPTDDGAAVEIDWRMLAKLNYRTGEIPDELKALDGKVVRIPGFVVPLEDYVESASEFLLVPYYGACVHVPPPPPNQMVYVEMENRRKAQFGWWEPIWLEGTLTINTVESPYGVVGFQLAGQKVEPYKN